MFGLSIDQSDGLNRRNTPRGEVLGAERTRSAGERALNQGIKFLPCFVCCPASPSRNMVGAVLQRMSQHDGDGGCDIVEITPVEGLIVHDGA